MVGSEGGAVWYVRGTPVQKRTVVEQIRHIKDGQGQILALAFRSKTLKLFQLSTFCSEAVKMRASKQVRGKRRWQPLKDG